MPEFERPKAQPVDQNQPNDGAKSVSEIMHDQLADATALYRKDHPTQAPKTSLLQEGLEDVASLAFKDKNTCKQIGTYGSELLKTAALFAPGKVGVAATILTYGADKASREDSLLVGTTDFALGATKGVVVKSLFNKVSESTAWAPGKGALMGIVSRGADITFDRNTLSNPLSGAARIKAEVFNPQALAVDAAVFGLGEGAFRGINKATAGRLGENRLAAGITMGGTFGAVNGSTTEILRQKAEGKDIDWSKVALAGVVDGGISALGAAAGLKSYSPRLEASLDRGLNKINSNVIDAAERFGLNREFNSREFVVVDGQEQLNKFAAKHEGTAELNVREVKRFLGFEKLGAQRSLFVQRLGEGTPGLRPAAANADLIATCFPETLDPAMRAKHLFPEAKGPVWLEAGEAGRLKLATGKTPWEHRNYNPIGKIVRLDGHQITMNVMGPLEIGNVRDPENPQFKTAWDNFSNDLERAKTLGADAVSTDVWWGAIEPKPGEFSWNYYDMMSSKIAAKNLKWVPILSLHECGGNVGDTANVPIPMWIWSKLQNSIGSSNPDVAKFKSEQGNTSHEYVSFWATKQALPLYRNVMTEFQNHFAGKAPIIAEINVSLGPAGELRYPSYNYHDNGSGWPTRGALQAYDDLARQSFKDFAVGKYGSEDAVKQAWGEKYGQSIEPPKNAEDFYNSGDYRNTQYGKDFFDWYSKSLQEHGDQVLSTALDVFGSKGAAFAGIDVGAKIPGVHWRLGYIDNGNVVLEGRQAELSAGLISTSRNDWNEADGMGYRPLLSVFKNLQTKSQFSRVIPHFTALELPDGQDGPLARSLPHSLATWVGQEANRQGMAIKGENALAGTLYDRSAWERMASLLKGWGENGHEGYYDGLTFLRMSDVLASDIAREQFAKILAHVRPQPEQIQKAQ